MRIVRKAALAVHGEGGYAVPASGPFVVPSSGLQLAVGVWGANFHWWFAGMLCGIGCRFIATLGLPRDIWHMSDFTIQASHMWLWVACKVTC